MEYLINATLLTRAAYGQLKVATNCVETVCMSRGNPQQTDEGPQPKPTTFRLFPNLSCFESQPDNMLENEDLQAPLQAVLNEQFKSEGDKVDLSGTDFSDWVSIQSLCARLSRSDNGKSSIYLDNCSLGRHGAAIVARSFTHVLIRAGNYHAQWLPLMFQNSRIKVLSMVNNKIGPDGAAAVAKMLRVNKGLKELNLKYNSIRSEGTQYLASSLCVNGGLQSLHLCGNEMCGIDEYGDGEYDPSGIISLTNTLQVNQHIKTLKIAENDLGDEGARYLADAIRVNTTLTTLDLHGNALFSMINAVDDALIQQLLQPLSINTYAPTTPVTNIKTVAITSSPLLLSQGSGDISKNNSSLPLLSTAVQSQELARNNNGNISPQSARITSSQSNINSPNLNTNASIKTKLNHNEAVTVVLVPTDSVSTNLDNKNESIIIPPTVSLQKDNTCINMTSTSFLSNTLNMDIATSINTPKQEIVLLLDTIVSTVEVCTSGDIQSHYKSSSIAVQNTTSVENTSREGSPAFALAIESVPVTTVDQTIIASASDPSIEAMSSLVISKVTMMPPSEEPVELSIKATTVAEIMGDQIESVRSVSKSVLSVLPVKDTSIPVTETINIASPTPSVRPTPPSSSTPPLVKRGGCCLLESLVFNNHLLYLDLSWNELNPAAAKLLEIVLAKNTILKSIHLGGNPLSDLGIKRLARGIISNESSGLMALNLDTCSIGPVGASYIANVLSQNTSLTLLNLSVNMIGSIGGQAMATAMKSNTTLRSLRIRHNGLGDSGAIAFASMLTTNSTLVKLSLRNNFVGNDGVLALSSALLTNTTLKFLDLSQSVQIQMQRDLVMSSSSKSSAMLGPLGQSLGGGGGTGGSPVINSDDINPSGRLGSSGVTAVVTMLKINPVLYLLNLEGHLLTYKQLSDLLVIMDEKRTFTVRADYQAGLAKKYSTVCESIASEREHLRGFTQAKWLRVHVVSGGLRGSSGGGDGSGTPISDSTSSSPLKGTSTPPSKMSTGYLSTNVNSSGGRSTPSLWHGIFSPKSVYQYCSCCGVCTTPLRMGNVHMILWDEWNCCTVCSQHNNEQSTTPSATPSTTPTSQIASSTSNPEHSHILTHEHLFYGPVSLIVLVASAVGPQGQCRSPLQVGSELCSYLRLCLSLGHKSEDIILVLCNSSQFDIAWRGKDPKSAGGVVAVNNFKTKKGITSMINSTTMTSTTSTWNALLRWKGSEEIPTTVSTTANGSRGGINSGVVHSTTTDILNSSSQGSDMVSSTRSSNVDTNLSTSSHTAPSSHTTQLQHIRGRQSFGGSGMIGDTLGHYNRSVSTDLTTARVVSSPTDNSSSPGIHSNLTGSPRSPLEGNGRAAPTEEVILTGDRGGPRMETRRRFEEAVRSSMAASVGWAIMPKIPAIWTSANTATSNSLASAGLSPVVNAVLSTAEIEGWISERNTVKLSSPLAAMPLLCDTILEKCILPLRQEGLKVVSIAALLSRVRERVHSARIEHVRYACRCLQQSGEVDAVLAAEDTTDVLSVAAKLHALSALSSGPMSNDDAELLLLDPTWVSRCITGPILGTVVSRLDFNSSMTPGAGATPASTPLSRTAQLPIGNMSGGERRGGGGDNSSDGLLTHAQIDFLCKSPELSGLVSPVQLVHILQSKRIGAWLKPGLLCIPARITTDKIRWLKNRGICHIPLAQCSGDLKADSLPFVSAVLGRRVKTRCPYVFMPGMFTALQVSYLQKSDEGRLLGVRVSCWKRGIGLVRDIEEKTSSSNVTVPSIGITSTAGSVCVIIEQGPISGEVLWGDAPNSYIDVLVWGEGAASQVAVQRMLTEAIEIIKDCYIHSLGTYPVEPVTMMSGSVRNKTIGVSTMSSINGSIRGGGTSSGNNPNLSFQSIGKSSHKSTSGGTPLSTLSKSMNDIQRENLKQTLHKFLHIICLRPGCTLETLALQPDCRQCGEYIDQSYSEQDEACEEPEDSPVVVICDHPQPRLRKGHLVQGYVLAESPGKGKGMMRSISGNLERILGTSSGAGATSGNASLRSTSTTSGVVGPGGMSFIRSNIDMIGGTNFNALAGELFTSNSTSLFGTSIEIASE